jgi:hypothetical protein
MSITEKEFDILQLSYDQQLYEQQQTNFIGDDANDSLRDWSGSENFFVSFNDSTGSEEYNREEEIEIEWATIAKLSGERWSKENPY